MDELRVPACRLAGRNREYGVKTGQIALIFGKDKYDLSVNLKCIQIVRAVEEFLDHLGLDTVHRCTLRLLLHVLDMRPRQVLCVWLGWCCVPG